MDNQEKAQVFDDEDLRSGFHVVPVKANGGRKDRLIPGKVGGLFRQEHYSYEDKTCFTKEEWAKINHFDLKTNRYLSQEEWNGLHPATV
jgi:hypothetical protein